MSRIDWGVVKRPPTKRELALYRRWKKYLSDSRLSKDEIDSRAKMFAEQHKQVPK